MKIQGLLKKSGSAEPWILDPTTDGAVDRAVHPVHGSTVDRTKGYPPDLIRTVCERSQGPKCVRAGTAAHALETVVARRCFAGGSPAHRRLAHRAPFRARAVSVFWTSKTTKGVPEVVDCAVRIVIGRPRTRRYVQGHGTQYLYRFGLPRWRTLRLVWEIKYGALCLVSG
jgi:hypothetical protein